MVGDPGLNLAHSVYPVTEGMGGRVFHGALYIRPEAHSVRIRDVLVHFGVSPQAFAARGINVADPREVGGWDLLRLLALDHREQLLATDAERRKRIALPLPQILQLDEWHHPDIMNHEKPSDTECFRMLAEVLATGDPSRYKPTEPPNTDWRNWPRGGML